MFMKKKTVIIVLASGCVLLVLCAIVAAVAFYSIVGFSHSSTTDEDDYTFDDITWGPSTEESLDEDEEESEDESTTPEEDTEIPQTATISGSVSYPSEYIPDTMTVCAENAFTYEEYCSESLIEDDSYVYGYGYALTVPAGSYYVYAVVPDLDPEYKAYYDEYVTCGMSIECDSHLPIMVTVLAGQEATEVDPMDWYAP